MPEIVQECNGIVVSIIVAEWDKRRIHVIGRAGRAGEPHPDGDGEPMLEPYEAFLVIGDEWTDGYEIEVETGLENADENHPEAKDYDGWCEEIECLLPMILWGPNQEYEAIITDEHRSLVAEL